jgi:hypothetical protein
MSYTLNRKQIKGHPNYWIYEDGRVWSDKVHRGVNGRFLIQSLNDSGYLRLSIEGETLPIHRLVCNHFVSGYNDGDQVCHNDSNKLNNWAHNLRWDTCKNNMLDKVREGNSARRDVMNGNLSLQKLSFWEVTKIVNLLQESNQSLLVKNSKYIEQLLVISIQVKVGDTLLIF